MNRQLKDTVASPSAWGPFPRIGKIVNATTIRRLPQTERLGLVLLMGAASGSSVVITRFGLSEIPALSLTMLRLAVATVAFTITLIMLRPQFPDRKRAWWDIALIGVINMGLPLAAFTLALQFMSSGVLAIFLALIPLFTGLIAHVVIAQERLTMIRLSGLVIAFAGVLLLLTTRTTGLSNGAGDLRGHLLALGGALSVAVATVYTRRRMAGVNVAVLTAGQMAVGFLFVMPLAIALNDVNVLALSSRAWFAVIYTGIIGSFLAFLVFFQLIKRFGATTAALPGFVTPAVSVSLGALVLGEVVTGVLVAGALVMLMGVYLANR